MATDCKLGRGGESPSSDPCRGWEDTGGKGDVWQPNATERRIRYRSGTNFNAMLAGRQLICVFDKGPSS